jgi:DNA-binding MarR family transcriptional regulator
MSGTDTLRAADALRRAHTRLSRRLRRLRADHGVSAAKLSLLSRLMHEAGPLTAVDLARDQRLQPQSLTRIIADLDARGLIARRQAEDDRRALLIEITQQGRDLLVRDARAQNAWLAEAMRTQLTSTEQALLTLATALLERLAGTPEKADECRTED